NITAVAFQVSSEAPAAPNLEDTVAMPALDELEDEPDEQTREYVDADADGGTMIVPPGELPGPEPEPAQPTADARRVRVVLIGVAVLALVAALVVWWLSR